MRYALYARKSHDDTRLTEKSLTDQIAVWSSTPAGQGLDIVRKYRESKSAKDSGVRPLFNDMIKRIKRGEFDAILTWHINRLTRNMVEGGIIADLLMRGMIREIRTPNAVYHPRDNIIPLILEAATATQNNRDHTEAVLRGMKSRTAEGGWTHRAPAGYLNQRDPLYSKRGILVRDPERFDVIHRAWQMLLTGSYSVQHVVDTMNNSWGFRTRQTAKRGGGLLTRSHGYKIFSNIFYAGYIHCDGMTRRGTHEPMITVSEFNKVQEFLRGEARPYGKRQFAFSGLIRCGVCGQQVTAEYHSKGNKSHTYYRCSDSYKTCTKKGINEKTLQAQIIQTLEQISIDPKLCAIALENIVRWQSGLSYEAEGVYQQLHRSLESVESQLNNLLTLRLRDVISDDALYKEKETALVAERNRLRISVQEAQERFEHVRQTAARGYNYVAFVRDQFLIADIEKKREYARSLGTYVLKDRQVSIMLHPLLEELVKFADAMIVTFEPRLIGFESRYRVSFSTRKSFGRAKKIQFEPVASLQQELQRSNFPELFNHL